MHACVFELSRIESGRNINIVFEPSRYCVFVWYYISALYKHA